MKRRQFKACDHSRGFTLFELVAVSLLLGFIAGVFSVGFRKSFHQADEQQAVELVLFYDQQSRTLADRIGKTVEMRFDENQGTLVRRVRGESLLKVLGTDLGIVNIKSLASEKANVVVYGTEGQSDPYVIQGKTSMTLVLGKTGQHLPIDDLTAAERLVDAGP